MRFLAVARARAYRSLAVIAALMMGLGLAACQMAPGSADKPITVRVNLQQAQRQAQQIDAAVAAALVSAQPLMNADQSAMAARAKAALDVAVNTFATLPSGDLAVNEAARNVLDAAAAVVNAVPVIPPQYKLVVDTGVAILDALIANMPLTVPAPAAAVSG